MTHLPIELPKLDRKHRNLYRHRADYDLAHHSYRVERVGSLGSLGSLARPALCAECGADTDDRLTMRTVFNRPRALRWTSRGRAPRATTSHASATSAATRGGVTTDLMLRRESAETKGIIR
jgi:hypothetical protein